MVQNFDDHNIRNISKKWKVVKLRKKESSKIGENFLNCNNENSGKRKRFLVNQHFLKSVFSQREFFIIAKLPILITGKRREKCWK